MLLVLVAVLVVVPGLATAAHLLLLAVASWAFREPRPSEPGPVPPVRFLVLVPAHDEARVIGSTLEALARARRDRDTLLVVADRCTDDTAAIARSFGAQVVERGPDEEPGRAAARQAGLDAARRLTWDAVAMVDADSIVDADFLDACERALASGADAVQVRSEAAPARSLVGQASVASFVLQGITVPRGRDALRLLVRLRGTGMVIRRALVERHRFRAPASEDLVYSLDLCLEGVRPRHVEATRVRSVMAGSWEAAATQRVRYEAGRMAAAREFLGPLLRRADPAAWEAAWFLATPPFALAGASLVAGGALGVLAGHRGVALVALGGLVALAAVLVTGLVQARAGWRTWAALLAAPWYVLWKLPVQARALASVRRREQHFPPTERA